MPQRIRTRTTKPAIRRVDPATLLSVLEQEKLRERLLAMILRNETARKQTPR